MSKRFVVPTFIGPWRIVFLISLIGLLGGLAYAQTKPKVDLSGKNVLILHAFETSSPHTLETSRGLLDALSGGGIPRENLFFESMDFRRNPGPEFRKLLAEQMRLKWSHRKADMIVTVYPDALEFVLKDCRDLFLHVPVIATHLPQHSVIADSDRRIVGHIPAYDVAGTIDIALKLVPTTNRIYIVSGAHRNDKWLEDQAKLASKKWEKRVEFLYLSHMTVEDIMATVSKATPRSLVLYLALSVDVAGKKGGTGMGLACDLSQVSTVPVFGLFESSLGCGMTGGSLTSWYLVGKTAGQLVLDVLKGAKNLEDVPPVLDVPSVPMFDWRQLRRWKLSEAALPKGSIVINREVTIWDFKYYIIGALVFSLAETGLIIALIAQRRRRRSAEESLKETGRKNRELIRYAPSAISEFDFKTGKFALVNDAMCQMLGYSREELLQMSPLEILNEESQSLFRDRIAKWLSGEEPANQVEYRVRAKDGHGIDALMNVSLSADAHGKPLGLTVIAHDITERKRTTESLRESEKRFRQVAEIVSDFVWEVDANGLYGYTSPSVEKILGYTPDELIGKKHFYDLFAPEVREELKSAALKTFAEKQPFHAFPNPNLHKQGKVVDLETSGSPILDAMGNLAGYRGADTDVTERKRSEKALAESQAQILALFDSTNDLIWSVDPEKFGLVTFNKGLQDYFYNWKRLVIKQGMPPEEMLPPEYARKWCEFYMRALKEGSYVTEYAAAAGTKHLLLSLNPLKRDGQVFGISVFGKDITQEKVAEQAIEERLRFEQLLSDLSSKFVNMPIDEVGSQINDGLRSITKFFDADRCLIGLFSEDRTQLALAFDYCRAEPDPAPGSLSKEQMPWSLGQLIQGKPIVMNRVKDLPPEAENERQLWLAEGKKSFLAIPLVSGGKILGSSALVSTRAEHAWPETLVKRFQLLSEVFGNVLQRKLADEASQKTERILRQSEKDLRKLTGRLIHAQEEERSRLARELHDDLAQRFAVFSIDIGQLEQQLTDPPASVLEQLREMKKNIDKLSKDVHSLSRQLHPAILDDLGLIKAVESECMNFSKREGIEIVFNHESISTAMPKEVSLSLYRIVQEGLTNISKHACAEHISVSLKGIDHDVLLSVQDDGIGFDWVEVQKQPGLGFSSMRERARLIHGNLSIQSQPEKGTVITLRVPLMKEVE